METLLIFLAFIGLYYICTYLSYNRKPKTQISKKEEYLNKCKSIILEYEKGLSIGAASCVNIIMQQIKENVYSSDDFSYDDITKNAHILVLNVCYFNLSSGQYHIYYAQLNPMGFAPSMKAVHDKCAKWLYENGYLSTDEYEGHMKQLRENIACVG